MNIDHQIYIKCWVTFSKIMKEYQYNIAITWPKYKYIGGVI